MHLNLIICWTHGENRNTIVFIAGANGPLCCYLEYNHGEKWMPYLCAFFLLVSFRVWTLACGGMCWQLKMFYFQNFAKQVQARPQCHSHCSPACWMLLTSVFHPLTVGTLPASWSFSLSWEIIFSQVMTLPCFLLIFYTISPRAQSLCFTPCFVLLLSSVYRLITLLSPHHISPSPSPSSPLSPSLSSKCVCVCVWQECNASACSHWQLAEAVGGGEDGEG